MTASSARVAAAETEMQAAEAANASANAALAALPDRSELLLLLDAYERHAALVERRAKGEVVVAERKADEAATGESLAAADRVLTRGRERPRRRRPRLTAPMRCAPIWSPASHAPCVFSW